MSKQSKIPITIQAVKTALSNLGYSARHNVIDGTTHIAGLPSQYSHENAANILPVLLHDYLIGLGYSATKERINDILSTIIDENRYNPIWDMLEETKYDGLDRITTLDEILGIENDEQSKKLLRKWLHQCIAMALNDDETPYGGEGVLVLQGAQGAGKTLFFSTLAINPDFFAEGACVDMNSKDTIIQSTNVWITELGELDSCLKKEQSSLKAFITSKRDVYRRPYERSAISKVRRTSFCGTVNPDQFLIDETGSRRFWTIHVEHIDVPRLLSLSEDWLKQMWRQVYEELYLPNPQGFRLTPDERALLESNNKVYEKPLPAEIEILDKLDFTFAESKWFYYKVSSLKELDTLKNYSAAQIGKVLAKLANNDSRIKIKNVHNVKQYLLPMI